jgi:hypothetical protein
VGATPPLNMDGQAFVAELIDQLAARRPGWYYLQIRESRKDLVHRQASRRRVWQDQQDGTEEYGEM